MVNNNKEQKTRIMTRTFFQRTEHQLYLAHYICKNSQIIPDSSTRSLQKVYIKSIQNKTVSAFNRGNTNVCLLWPSGDLFGCKWQCSQSGGTERTPRDSPRCRGCLKANVTRIRIPNETPLVDWFPPLLRQVFHRYSGIPLSSNINFSKLQFDLQRETENNFVEF